ncbi:MAG: LysM peptidoglycan-binding domain-containing protein [Vicinamibacteria bacterium]
MTTRKFFTSSLALAGLTLGALASAQMSMPGTVKVARTSEAAAVGPFQVAPHWSRYDYPRSIGEGQAYYIVVRGDTLWDISGRFLGNPFLWPQIWEANKYITKARLIYPGDPIFLPTVQLAGMAGGEAETESTDVTTKMVEILPLPEWLDLDALVPGASIDTVRFAGYIVASLEDESLKVKGMEAENGTLLEKVTAGAREYVYLDRGASSGIKAGDLYTVNRRSRVIKHPVTGKKVGYRIETKAIARILLVGENSARAVIERSAREVLVGDYLRPLVEVESPLVKRRVIIEGGDLSLDGNGSTGYVLDIEDDSVTAASGVAVGLDVGTGSGISVGKIITVFRQGDKRDIVTRRALGAAVIVAVRENFSVARLVYSREEIIVGDRVIVQP